MVEGGLRRQLTTFDVSSLVVGSIIGADIYVAAAIGARLVGPISLLIWLVAGIMAITIALSFSHSATIMPRAGGPYSYVKAVAGPFPGFLVGWSLLLAEWFSLAVFPVAFTQYFLSFFPNLDAMSQVLLKGFFILVVLTSNILGIKVAGRFNDFLTMAKLAPLLLLMLAGLLFIGIKFESSIANFQPLVQGDAYSFGQALVLIFWAYAGFELSTLPADEIQQPERTIPKAIVLGMVIVMIFYLVTNFVIIAVVDQETLANTPAPLTVAAARIFGVSLTWSLIGSILIGIGALISIMGADESGTIGTSRLAFAMSIDGLLPRMFSRLHKNFGTPYIGLTLLCSTAFIASIVSALTELINASVFLLSFSYMSTCLSTLLLQRKYPKASLKFRARKVIPLLGMAFSFLLMTQVVFGQILISLLLMAVGVPLYIFFTPKKELHELKDAFLSREAVLKRAYDQGQRFLAYFLHRLKWMIIRIIHLI